MSYIAPERTQTHVFNTKLTEDVKLCKLPKNIAGYIYIAVALILLAVTTFITTWENLMALITLALMLVGLFTVLIISGRKDFKTTEHNRKAISQVVIEHAKEINELMKPYTKSEHKHGKSTHDYESPLYMSGCQAAAMFQYGEKNPNTGFVSSTYEETEDGVKRTQDGADFTFEIISDDEVRITVKLP